MQLAKVIARLQSLANPANVAGMARFGINPHNTLGINIYTLRSLGKRNRMLNEQAIAVARDIQARGTRPGCWIAADALRELSSQKVQQ